MAAVGPGKDGEPRRVLGEEKLGLQIRRKPGTGIDHKRTPKTGQGFRQQQAVFTYRKRGVVQSGRGEKRNETLVR